MFTVMMGVVLLMGVAVYWQRKRRNERDLMYAMVKKITCEWTNSHTTHTHTHTHHIRVTFPGAEILEGQEYFNIEIFFF